MTEGNWFFEHRQAWIKESVEIFGQMNRENLMRKFGISTAQAATDFAEAMRRHPEMMSYNTSTKRYERNGD